MKTFIKDLIYGTDGKPSCTTVMALTLLALFVFVTLYLVLNGKTWDNYAAFVGSGIAGMFGQVCGKFINHKGEFK